MSISLRTHKMLWGRSGNRCAFPDCRRALVEDDTLTDDPSVVGDEAHIVAREDDGPRGTSTLTKDERDKYDNLVLLCKIHHKKIDDQPNTYTVEYLRNLKADHLDWVTRNLSPNEDKQRDDETYASYLDKWLDLADVDNWKNWASNFLAGDEPSISHEQYEKLKELNNYLLSRVWPNRYEKLEFAFKNFRLILNDLLRVFDKYRETIGDETNKIYKVEKIYRRTIGWNEAQYNQLMEIFEFHVALISDLMCELTRAANHLCSEVRRNLIHSFRLQEGTILVVTGPDWEFNYVTLRLEYKSSDREEFRYKGLQSFMTDRENYDLQFGKGVTDRYLPFNPEK